MEKIISAFCRYSPLDLNVNYQTSEVAWIASQKEMCQMGPEGIQ